MNNTNDYKPEGIKPVESIPGNLLNTTQINLKVKSYSGYASANNGSHLFTWFFGSQKMTDEKRAADFPLLIWLNGGPGASSMAGAILENGPYLQSQDQFGTMVENPYAWNKENHIMYWDNPVGSGFSYNEDGKYVDNEDELSTQFYEALQSFYDTMPSQYRDCELYITGESYGGKYIPAITEKIMEMNDSNRGAGNTDRLINIKGMAIGNPWMDPVMQTKFRLQTGFELGFLDTKQHAILMDSYSLLPKLIEDKQYEAAFQLNQSLKNKLIACAGGIAIYDVRIWDDGLFGSGVDKYFRMDAVKEALHAPGRPFNDADETGPVTENLIEDYMTNTAACDTSRADYVFCLPKLLDRVDENDDPALRVLIYTGNLDMSCGIRGTEYILHNCAWRYQDAWQNLDREVWAEPQGNTKGYIKYYKNLMQIVIPQSGHLVPCSQPQNSLEMVTNFVFQRRYPSYDPLNDE
ncbi:MAG: S10 family peptidase [bacterium]|nr:S10 family peptidase [bacterium]